MKPCTYANCPHPTGGRAYCRAHAEYRAVLIKKLRFRRYLAGLCGLCGRKRDEGYRTCARCRDRLNCYNGVSRIKREIDRKRRCVCTVCKVQLRDARFVKCADCRREHAAAARRTQEIHQSRGRCPCGQERDRPDVISCRRCRERYKRKAKLRKEIPF